MAEHNERGRSESTQTRTMPGDDPLLKAARDEAIRRWNEQSAERALIFLIGVLGIVQPSEDDLRWAKQRAYELGLTTDT